MQRPRNTLSKITPCPIATNLNSMGSAWLSEGEKEIAETSLLIPLCDRGSCEYLRYSVDKNSLLAHRLVKLCSRFNIFICFEEEKKKVSSVCLSNSRHHDCVIQCYEWFSVYCYYVARGFWLVARVFFFRCC